MHQSPPITIVPFDDRYAADFERLNRAWLELHEMFEPLDAIYLGDPRGKILARGGEIFFALRDGAVVGTAAAIPTAHPEVIELAKLTVAREARGAGLGERLIAQVIAFARAHGATRVSLTSSTQLRTALALYARLGFIDRPMPNDLGYERADVYMELELTPSSLNASTR